MEKAVQEIKPKAHVALWKKEAVKELARNINNYKTIAVLNMENLPSAQLQNIRSKIKEKAIIKMTRKSIICRALQSCTKPNAKELIQNIEGMPAILLSNENAFDIFRILNENMSSAPAKGGQISPEDIIIKAGPTQFGPGPILGELGNVGLIAGVENGKISIKKSSTVIKKGEVISAELAGVLSKLEIKPMKIGINLIAALEDNQIYSRNILNIDTNKFIKDLKEAYQNAFKLSVAQGIIIKENITYLLQQAYLNAKKLATAENILTDETKEAIIKKAESHAKILKEKVSKTSVEEPEEKDLSKHLSKEKSNEESQIKNNSENTGSEDNTKED